MSVIEMLTAMYRVTDLDKIRSHAPDRARIIVSKGHSAAGTYAVMAEFGLIDREMIGSYHSDGSILAGHVSHAVPCVEHSTGALGHGLSVGVGCALGLRSRGFPRVPVMVLTGDGELQEGSNWEAVMLAHHLKLSNLVLLVDNNGISSITKTNDVIDMTPLAQRFAGFGLSVDVVPGHDVARIEDAIRHGLSGSGPHVVICNTVKGYGVPFAENQPIWHYRSLDAAGLETALKHLSAGE